MDTFNLLALPLVARRHILQNCSLLDLFNFSRISTETYSIVKNAGVRAKSGLSLEETDVLLTFCYPFEINELTWIFGRPEDFYEGIQGVTIVDAKPLVINGTEFCIQFAEDRPCELYTKPLELSKRISTIFGYFGDLFNCTSYSNILLKAQFSDAVTTTLSGLEPRRTDLLRFENSSISGTELSSMLERLDYTKRIALDGFFTGYLDCSKLASTRSIHFTKHNVTSAAFLKLKTSNIYLEGVSYSEKVLTRFVNQWLKSTDSQLESVILKIHEPGIWDFAEQFYEKFNALAWHSKRRAKMYKWKEELFLDPNDDPICEWDCSEARDIVRSDGLLASIRLTATSFEMFVWHKRFNDY